MGASVGITRYQLQQRVLLPRIMYTSALNTFVMTLQSLHYGQHLKLAPLS